MSESTKQVELGLGEAVRRLLSLELRVTRGLSLGPEDRSEREMLLSALNAVKLDLGFDCNSDGVPDTVEIFEQSANTSCCRLVYEDTSRRKPAKRSRRRKKK